MTQRDDWTRINGRHRTRNTRKGLQARIADPLWTLCRQWQFGGFQGEDAASPIKTELVSSSLNVQNIIPVDEAGKTGKPLKIDNTALLEAEIEAEDVINGIASPRISAEAGIQFLRQFSSGQQRKLLPILQTKLPLKLNDNKIGKSAFLDRLIRKSFDGAKMSNMRLASVLSLLSASGIAENTLEKKLNLWHSYYQDRFLSKNQQHWQSPRQEYSFAIQTEKQGQTQPVLQSTAYNGGQLDWYHFNLWTKKSTGLDQKLKKTQPNYLIPTPVRYAGMPAERFWDFEDGKVFFGGLAANSTDLAQMILTEFATIYSNDWYMLPLPVPSGSITRVETVTVYDCFGEKHSIKPTAVNDGKNRDWRFFELKGDPSAEKGFAPWLYSPRTLLGGQEDKPVEKVIMTRDEMANMAWAIEEKLETQSGHTMSRHAEYMRYRDQIVTYLGNSDPLPDDATEEQKDAWVYRLLSITPPYWVPFSPEIKDNKTTNTLRRSRMREWDLLGELKETLAGGQGKILEPDKPFFIYEEEIPRGAIEITRSYQAARDASGKLIVWNGRKKRPSSGNRSSDRTVDMVEINKRVAS